MISPEGFALEVFSDGAVLLDLESGVLFRLNPTAAFVWERALSGVDPREIVPAFAGAFGVSEDVARADVTAALAPPSDSSSLPPPTDTLYEPIDDGYRFSIWGEPVFEIKSSGQALRTLKDLTSSELYFDLKSLSPKLVALLGPPVLHASAVRDRDGRVTAFLGESGAGKTTTARAFASTGLELVCEDKLVLRRDGQRMLAVLDGEARIETWMKDIGARLQNEASRTWCDVGALRDVTDGDVATIGKIMVVDETRRRPAATAIDLRPLGPAEAAAEIFRNAFYGSFAFVDWHHRVGIAAALARAIPTFAASVPDGLEALILTVRRYTERTQS